jgi:hypothetical protein
MKECPCLQLDLFCYSNVLGGHWKILFLNKFFRIFFSMVRASQFCGMESFFIVKEELRYNVYKYILRRKNQFQKEW